MNVLIFNNLDTQDAASVIRPCLGVDRWIESIVENRPYKSTEDLMTYAGNAAERLSDAEIASALAHHPRIGERAEGGSTEATLSRREQSGINPDEEIARSLTAGNRAYEQRFDRVFLIRAASRSGEQILAELNRRLANTDEAESREVGEQLAEIALLRLGALFEFESAH